MNRLTASARLALALSFAAPSALLAQTSGEVIIDRVNQGGAPTPAPAAPAPSPSEQGDLDGGTQRLAQTRQLPFKLTLGYDLQAFYTNNVFLSPSDEVDALVVANTLSARVNFDSVAIGDGLLTPSVGLVYQRFNHALGSGDQAREDLDFDAYTLPLALRLRYGRAWEFGLGVTPTLVYSLEGPPDYNLTYQSLPIGLSARRYFTFAQNRFATLGAGLSYNLTEADTPAGILGYRDDRNDKLEASLDAAYYYLIGAWTLSPYARLAHVDYAHWEESGFNSEDRADTTYSLGLSASYAFARWGTVRLFASSDIRDSKLDGPVIDYTYKTLSAGATLSLRY